MKLDDAVERYYDGLPENRQERAEVFQLVISTLEQNTVNGWTPKKIKKFTKIAEHVFKSDAAAIRGELLERLFYYNLHGAQRASSSPERIGFRKMEAHLYSHAADVAEALYLQTNNKKWLEAAYANNLISGNKAQKCDLFHAGHAYTRAANAARKLFDSTQDRTWLIRAYTANLEGARTAESGGDSNHALFSFSAAGNDAWQLAHLTQDTIWARRGIDAYQEHLNRRYGTALSRKEQGIVANIQERLSDLRAMIL